MHNHDAGFADDAYEAEREALKAEIDFVEAQHEAVHHPAHYTQGPIECIHVTEQLSFCLGNAIKYAWRYNEKGSPAQDLRKAAWYVRREAERLRSMWLLRRLWHWAKLRLMAYELMNNLVQLPSIAVLVVCDCANGDFEMCARYLEGMAVTFE